MTRLENPGTWWQRLLSFDALEYRWALSDHEQFDGQWEFAGPGYFTDEETVGLSRG